MFQVLVWLITFIYNILSYIFSQVSSERDSDNNSNSPKPKKKPHVTSERPKNSSQPKKNSDGKENLPSDENSSNNSNSPKPKKKPHVTSENSSQPKKKRKRGVQDVKKDDNNSTNSEPKRDVPMHDVTSDDNRNRDVPQQKKRDVTPDNKTKNDVQLGDQPPEKKKRDVPEANGSSDEQIIVKKKTVQASLRRSARVQKRKEKVQAICKKAKEHYSKRLAATFILSESSVTYHPPAGYYGSFGIKESNVQGKSEDDEDDVDEETESSASHEEVILKKPKKGFIDNEVIFTDDDTEIDNTLKNNIGEDLGKMNVEDLSISKILDSSDKDEIFEIATEKKSLDDITSQYPGIFVRPKCDVQDSKSDVQDVNSDSKRDVQDVNSDSKCDVQDVNSNDSKCDVQDQDASDVNSLYVVSDLLLI